MVNTGTFVPNHIKDDDGQSVDTFGVLDRPNFSPQVQPILLGTRYQGLKAAVLEKLFENEEITHDTIPEFYLYNQTIDPDLTPNEYTHPGGAKDIEFKWILSTCKGLYDIQEPSKTSKDYAAYNDLHTIPASDFLDAIGCEPNNEDPDVVLESEDFLNIENVEAQIVEEDFMQIALSTIENEYIKNHDKAPATKKQVKPTSKKFIDVFTQFQKQHCCEKTKEGCGKVHYMVGFGQYTLGEKVYSGVHVVRFPEFLSEQKSSVDISIQKIRNPQDKIKQGEVAHIDRVRKYAKELRKTIE